MSDEKDVEEVVSVEKVDMPITLERRAELSGKLVMSIRALEKIEGDWKEVAAQHRAEVEKRHTEIRAHARSLETGKEPQDVQVRTLYDFKANRVQVIHAGTGEILKERAMSAVERDQLAQRKIDQEKQRVVDARKKFKNVKYPTGNCSCGSGTPCEVHTMVEEPCGCVRDRAGALVKSCDKHNPPPAPKAPRKPKGPRGKEAAAGKDE